MNVAVISPRSLLGAWLWKREFIKAPAFSCFSCCLWHMEGCNFTRKSELTSYQVPIYFKQGDITTLELLKPCVLSLQWHGGQERVAFFFLNQPVTSLRLAVTKVIQLMTPRRAGVGDSDKHLGWGSRRTNLSLGFCYSGLCWFPKNCKTLETNG